VIERRQDGEAAEDRRQWRRPCGGKAACASAESGGTITLDARPEHGGTGQGPSPMETLLLALAGCTGMDVVSILGKMRAPLDGLEIRVSGDRADDHPRVFTRIRLEYVFRGNDLRPEQAGRAVQLSQEKYCSVSAMLRASAELTYTWRIAGGI
jgi:putative redox protein